MDLISGGVPCQTSYCGDKTFQTMLDVFRNCGYIVQKKILNAWDYGNAQKRERLITIGILQDLVDKIKIDFPTPHKYKPVLKDVLKDVPPSIGAEYSAYLAFEIAAQIKKSLDGDLNYCRLIYSYLQKNL